MTETVFYIQKSLAALYSAEEIRSLTQWILEKVCNLTLAQQISNKSKHLSVSEKERIEGIVERLQKHEPIQYILGEVEFYGLTFQVNPSVLIPRPETEELVYIILQDSAKPNIRIMDLCTGSGCIAVTLAKHIKNAEVFAVDISAEALHTAQMNATSNQAFIHFSQTDVLSDAFKEAADFPNLDVIVSNPPYVTESEKKDMQQHVIGYEPSLALFVSDEKPLLFYEHIAAYGLKKLVRGGLLFFEINCAYGVELVEMIEKLGYSSVLLMSDLSEKSRFIKAVR